MVTLEQLKKQIAGEKSKRDNILQKEKLVFEKSELQKELKKLQRKPSTSRNIKLAKRTGRGLKILGTKVGKAALRQGKRIRDQQLRDSATISKAQKKKSKKIGKKLKRGGPLDLFEGFPGSGF